LLIVSAERRELAGVARRADGLEKVHLGLRWSRLARLAGRRVVLAANGAGRVHAARAVHAACQRLAVRAVVSTGWCGGLAPELRVSQVVVADRVLSVEPPAAYQVRLPDGAGFVSGDVVTVDRFVQTAAEKRKLFLSTGAIAVEMEAAGAAEEAQKRGLPFFCVRVVSDEAGESFEMDFNRSRLADGRFSIPRVLAQAGVSVTRWKELLNLRSRDRLASETLGEFFAGCRFES
jgi:nucleoside phosphorylase